MRSVQTNSRAELGSTASFMNDFHWNLSGWKSWTLHLHTAMITYCNDRIVLMLLLKNILRDSTVLLDSLSVPPVEICQSCQELLLTLRSVVVAHWARVVASALNCRHPTYTVDYQLLVYEVKRWAVFGLFHMLTATLYSFCTYWQFWVVWSIIIHLSTAAGLSSFSIL